MTVSFTLPSFAKSNKRKKTESSAIIAPLSYADSIRYNSFFMESVVAAGAGRRFQGLYPTVRTNLSSLKELLENVVQFIFEDINPFIKENPA